MAGFTVQRFRPEIPDENILLTGGTLDSTATVGAATGGTVRTPEVKSGSKKRATALGRREKPVDPRFVQFKTFVFEDFKHRKAQPPSWGPGD